MNPQAVVDAIVAEANTRIDQGVADGRITAEKAAELRANATTKANEMLDRTPPAPGERGPRGGHRGFGGGEPGNAPSAARTA